MSSMRSDTSRPGRRLKNEINVVPYIDVMLVLLVIFMVTAPLITPGVVELPSVGQAASVPVAPLEFKSSKTVLCSGESVNQAHSL
jgi:biopolymer transport protein TolR